MSQEEEYRESVQKVTAEFVETGSRGWHHEGSNDQKRNRMEIQRIVDADGGEHEPICEDEPTELLPGVFSRREGGRQFLRISREACPLRVLFRWYAEYVSYTDSEHNSSWTTYYWVRYEAG